MKYAIIGKGFIYPRHVQAIKATGGEVILTCDSDIDKGADFLNWREMMASPEFKEVDAVTICTPNYLHREMALEALKLGKKVLCEKPLSIQGTEGLEGVNTVLQLRYAPNVLKTKAALNEHLRDVSMDISVYRDDSYWKGWKGDDAKSGGILYNLGIHYFDLLIFLFGDEYHIHRSFISKDLATGVITFKNTAVDYSIDIHGEKGKNIRRLEIKHSRKEDDLSINLSNHDNLSYEGLHEEVYKHFIKGEGIPLSEARKSLKLVSELIEHGTNS